MEMHIMKKLHNDFEVFCTKTSVSCNSVSFVTLPLALPPSLPLSHCPSPSLVSSFPCVAQAPSLSSLSASLWDSLPGSLSLLCLICLAPTLSVAVSLSLRMGVRLLTDRPTDRHLLALMSSVWVSVSLSASLIPSLCPSCPPPSLIPWTLSVFLPHFFFHLHPFLGPGKSKV